jgi:ribosomal protein S18 acetylase RimI-like enzyme
MMCDTEGFDMRMALDKETGSIAALCCTAYSYSFFSQPDASIEVLFVNKDYRGSADSRMIVSAAMEEARERNAGFTYACVASGVSPTNDQQYINLFKKHGFQDLGFILSHHRGK